MHHKAKRMAQAGGDQSWCGAMGNPRFTHGHHRAERSHFGCIKELDGAFSGRSAFVELGKLSPSDRRFFLQHGFFKYSLRKTDSSSARRLAKQCRQHSNAQPAKRVKLEDRQDVGDG